MKIATTTASTITDLWAEIEPRLQQATHLETAAQALATALHRRFEESVVIARVFLTVPFAALPAANKTFVQQLAASGGAASELKATTPVLSLLGTHGQETDWNDRRKSKGHLSIPLISSAFVGAIPMISRLLHELGVPLSWVDSHDSKSVIEHIGHSAGLFFVENASEATDHAGRKIIVAQDFVSAYQVKSVFGIGGAYPNGQMLVTIVFCRDLIARASAECFLALSTFFQGKTNALVNAQKIFADG